MENFELDFYESLIFPCRGRVLSSESLMNIYLTDNSFLEKANYIQNNSRKVSTKEIGLDSAGQKQLKELMSKGEEILMNSRRFKSLENNLHKEPQDADKEDEKKVFNCQYEGCKRGYNHKSRLQIHERTHTGLKPFKCEECNRSFNEKGNLMTHMRIHTGEKPYKCTYENCKKEFKAYGHLSDHLKRHFNIRPYECEICKSSFSRRNTLKTHMMIHTGEKPYKCYFSSCEKRFSEKGNMRTHYKTHMKKLITEINEVKPLDYCVNRCQDFSFIGKKCNRKNSSKLLKKEHLLINEKCKINSNSNISNNSTNSLSNTQREICKESPTILENSFSPNFVNEDSKVQNTETREDYLEYSQLIDKFSESQLSLFFNIRKNKVD